MTMRVRMIQRMPIRMAQRMTDRSAIPPSRAAVAATDYDRAQIRRCYVHVIADRLHLFRIALPFVPIQLLQERTQS